MGSSAPNPPASIPWAFVVSHEAVTPSDVTQLQNCHALFIGGDGNLSAEVAGETLVYPVTAGMILPLAATRVLAATTATNIRLWRFTN